MNETRTKRDLLETMEKMNKQNKKNKEQKEEALAFLNTAVEIGNKIFCCIPVKMLRIDHDMYQRPLQKSFKYLLDNWDSDKCDPITVNYRSDAASFFMVKGIEMADETDPKVILQMVNESMKKLEEILEDIAE